MSSHPLAKKSFILGTLFLALAVLIGAFGAHGLKNFVEADKLVTFETGVRYQFYHAIGLMLVGVFQQLFSEVKTSAIQNSFLVGILLFSFNCYFYVLSGIKVFALIVPVGGVLFAIGWILFFLQALKLR